MKFCFVILHYKTEEDTIACVRSIQNLKQRSYIVIVDNASNNGSIEKIESLFSNSKDIFIIKNKENLGFAEGNNVGYQYARNVLKADFIAVSNNDIIVHSENIIELVVKLYKRKQYHVLGPDIESVIDHGHQNPMMIETASKKKIYMEIARYRLLYTASKIHLYDALKKRKATIKAVRRQDSYLETQEDVQLHGAFVIFSPHYVKNEEHVFRQGTFLYMEEAILYRYCLRKQYIMLYFPTIKVLHKEDSSTNSLFDLKKEKREFVFKNMIASLKVYMRYI